MEPNLEISGLVTPFVNFFKLINNECRSLMEIGISEYLDSQTEKFFYTNTFLHRSEKVQFYNIYYPIKASYHALITEFTYLEQIFEDYKNITIIGSAGSGKSTLIRYIFLETLKNKSRIPILIELRNLNDYEGDLEKLIIEKILRSRIKPSEDILKRAMRRGHFLFLLDGYDEIYSKRKEEIKRQIESFTDDYRNNRFLMTTRPGSGIESFPRFRNFQICALGEQDIADFVDKMVVNPERNKRIKAVINDPGNHNYIHYLGNPLLLSMFILAFENHPEIPSRKSAFFRNVFDTLYSKHDGITKNSFVRERLTKLHREDFEEILCKFSYLTLCNGIYAFTYELLTDKLKKVRSATSLQFTIEDLIADLQTSTSILIMDGFEYRFPHKSMQEYFAAQFISNLHPDKKVKAYENMKIMFRTGGSDNNFAFWDLCYELDPVYFISKFVLPELNWYAEELNKETDDALLSAFAGLWGLHSRYDDQSDRVTISFIVNYFTSFTEYFKLIDDSEIYFFPEKSHSTKKLIALLTIKGIKEQSPWHTKEDKQFLKILLDAGFAGIVKRIRTALNEKIAALEAEIKRAENNIDELLNL